MAVRELERLLRGRRADRERRARSQGLRPAGGAGAGNDRVVPPDLGIGILLVLALAPITGAEIGWQIVFVPLLCVAILVPAVAVAIPLAGLAVYYRDFKYALPTGVQLWFFASPVVYPITVVSPEWRWLYALLNPVVGMLEGFRRVLAEGASPDWGLLGISLASSLVLLFAGLRVFKRLEGEFADVI